MGALEQAMKYVQFPAMRAEVIGAVRALSDPEYQRRVWVRREFPTTQFYDDFMQRVNILDDLRILEDPAAAVGDVLRSAEEAETFAPLSDALRDLFETHGTDLRDEDYLNVPEWTAVVVAARNALNALTEPDE
jgi:hypothetical protein